MPSDLSPTLRTDLAGLSLASPIILASGTCGTLDEMASVIDLRRLGAITTKSITPKPRDGHKPWRVVGVNAGMLNAVGLANPGLERFEREFAPRVAQVACPVIGSVAGFSMEDYLSVCAMFERIPAVAAVELNVSCPNVAHGIEFAADPDMLAQLIARARTVLATKRMIVKLSPVLIGTPNSIVTIARAAIDPGSRGVAATPGGPNGRPGADALSLCNTVPAMAIDVDTRRPLVTNTTGGLGGPAVHPIAVRLIHEVYRGVARDTATPIIGIGGVMTWRDAAEFVLAGATAIGVGTASFVDPRRGIQIARGLARWVKAQRHDSLAALVGGVVLNA